MGEALVFLTIAKGRGGERKGGTGTLLTCPSVKRDSSLFPALRAKDLGGYVCDL